MTTRAEMERKFRQSDPMPSNLLDDPATSELLFASILERRDEMTHTDLPSPVRPQIPSPPRSRRPAWAFLTTLVAILAAIGALVIWLAGTDGSRDVAPDTPTPTSLVDVPESWTVYTSADGVPVNCLCDVALAADGSLWVVDLDGIAHFDGERWQSVPPPRAFHHEGLPGVAAAPDGSIWITGGDYLARFADAEWTIIAEATDLEEYGAFQDVFVTSHQQVFVQEGDQLKALVDGELQGVDTSYQLGVGSDTGFGVPMPIEGPDGALWFSVGGWGSDPIVGRVDGTTVTTLEVSGEGPGALLSVAPDRSLWFAAEFWGPTNIVSDDVGRLVHFNGHSWTSYELGGVSGTAFEEDGTAWFLVDEITGDELWWRNQYSDPGVYRFDGQLWRHFTTEDWLPGLDVSAITLDLDGSLWIATSTHGIVHYQPGTKPNSGTPVDVGNEPLLEWPDNATTTTPSR